MGGESEEESASSEASAPMSEASFQRHQAEEDLDWEAECGRRHRAVLLEPAVELHQTLTTANLEHYAMGYERNKRADTNVDIDPKTHYVFKAYA